MLRNPINRSPEIADVASASTETAPVSRGFEALSESSVIEETVNANTAADVIVETPEQIQAKKDLDASAAATAAATTPVIVDTFDDKGNQTDATGAIVKTKEQIDSEQIVTEFKVPGAEVITETPEEAAKKKALDDLATESSWIKLAKVKGLDIADDSFEAYDKAIDAKFAQDSVAVKEAAKLEAKNELLAEKPAEVMAIIEGLEQGFTIEEILEPRKNIEALEALSNAELVAEDCRLKGWPTELIDKHIAELTEKETLDVAAQPLRDILKSNKDVLAQKQVDQLASLKLSKATAEKQVRQKESDEIKNAIVSMKEYMGVPITDNVVDHIQKKWNNGEYHEAFKDTKLISEFLMHKEFGEQGLKALKNREYQRGRDEKAMKLHNVPPIQVVGGKANPSGEVKVGFDKLPNS